MPTRQPPEQCPLTSSCHDNHSYCNDEAATNGNVNNTSTTGDIVSTVQSTSISNLPITVHEEDVDNVTNYDVTNYDESTTNYESSTIPLPEVTSPPITSSDGTPEGSDSENAELVTIHLKASGCYLYKLSEMKPKLVYFCKRDKRKAED